MGGDVAQLVSGMLARSCAGGTIAPDRRAQLHLRPLDASSGALGTSSATRRFMNHLLRWPSALLLVAGCSSSSPDPVVDASTDASSDRALVTDVSMEAMPNDTTDAKADAVPDASGDAHVDADDAHVDAGDAHVDAADAPADVTLDVPAEATPDATVDGAADARDSAVEADAPVPPINDPSCVLEETSTLPHVRFVMRSSQCTFTLEEAASGIAIAYDLVVDEDVPGFVTGLYPYPPDAARLQITAQLKGGDQSYCYCDRGLPYPLCPDADGGVYHPGPNADGGNWLEQPCEPFTIPAGIYHQTFTWSGRNWSGPSDTADPMGNAFPPGEYELEIRTNAGTLPGVDGSALAARARFRVHLIL
jgi:hypothetical protein